MGMKHFLSTLERPGHAHLRDADVVEMPAVVVKEAVTVWVRKIETVGG